MEISTRQAGTAIIFDVSGDIDLANSPQFRKALLHEVRENRAPCVMLNMSQVRYIDSSGVASLVEGLQASRALGSRFVLFGLNATARGVLQVSRLLKVFEVYDNEEEALAT